jgi:hypothetical protein
MKVKIFTKNLKTKGGFLSGVGTVSDDGLKDELNLWLASQPNIDVESYPIGKRQLWTTDNSHSLCLVSINNSTAVGQNKDFPFFHCG